MKWPWSKPAPKPEAGFTKEHIAAKLAALTRVSETLEAAQLDERLRARWGERVICLEWVADNLGIRQEFYAARVAAEQAAANSKNPRATE